jgi:heavy metal sensor kinase
MSSKPPTKIRHTLAFRLTLWYAGIFSLTACLAFFFFYVTITSMLRQRLDQALVHQADELLTASSLQGIEEVRQMAIMQAQAAGERRLFIRLLYPTGVAFSSSNMDYWQTVGVDREAVRRLFSGEDYVFSNAVIDKRREPVRVVYTLLSRGIVLQVGQSMEADQRIVDAFRKNFIGIMALLVLLAAGSGWFMARRAIAGLQDVTRTARRISKDDLDNRVPLKGRGDEIDELAATFNQMLDRIRSLVVGMREMSDNIAHDLKSPITRIRGIAEVTLASGKTVAEYEQMAADTIEACDRLLDMINTMLTISETEAGLGRLESESFNLAALVADAGELFLPLAEDKNVSLTWQIPPKANFIGDMRKIQRMIANLLDNAIKYTKAGGNVEMRLLPASGSVDGLEIMIQDSGMGIGEKDLPHIFQRFYRCDHSRSMSGTGLGLSLARAIARAHGGEITVTSVAGQGSVFTVWLPTAVSIAGRSSP